jgi:hypothetical protein
MADAAGRGAVAARVVEHRLQLAERQGLVGLRQWRGERAALASVTTTR